MALKRPNNMLSEFSMASMTDVVFLLLVFFMVTSAFVFPTALEIDLPESSQQTPVKPSTRVPENNLIGALQAAAPADSLGAIAVYADAEVPYGKVVEVLNIGADNTYKMVLATRPSSPKSSRQ